LPPPSHDFPPSQNSRQYFTVRLFSSTKCRNGLDLERPAAPPVLILVPARSFPSVWPASFFLASRGGESKHEQVGSSFRSHTRPRRFCPRFRFLGPHISDARYYPRLVVVSHNAWPFRLRATLIPPTRKLRLPSVIFFVLWAMYLSLLPFLQMPNPFIVFALNSRPNPPSAY